MANLILTGFMATGKTEVGRLLARRFGCPFFDTDGLVETAARRTIAQIFASDGEAHFRALERDAVGEACAVPDAVIATGGGTLLDERAPVYALATHTVDTSGLTVEQVAERVQALVAGR